MQQIPDGRVVNNVVLLPVEHIVPNPDQPRRVFGEQALLELAQSIAQNGLLQPISVRERAPGEYQLIAGERRLRAFRKLGYSVIPAIVEEMDDYASKRLALIENLQRADLNFFEQAEAMASLLQEHGLSQAQLAERLGMAQSTVANKLRLLRFAPLVRRKIQENGLTERHARCLLQISGERRQLEVIAVIAQRQLNVAQTERYIASLLESHGPKPTRIFILKDVRIFLNTINKAVETMKLAGIPAVTQQSEDDEYINLTVRIPKKHAQRSRTSA